jgi:hypothetical protein
LVGLVALTTSQSRVSYSGIPNNKNKCFISFPEQPEYDIATMACHKSRIAYQVVKYEIIQPAKGEAEPVVELAVAVGSGAKVIKLLFK